jgi:hypothetical protein
MQPKEIKDRESLRAWLGTRSRTECIRIASRCALRVAPKWFGQNWVDWTHLFEPTDVLVLRPLLLSHVLHLDGVHTFSTSVLPFEEKEDLYRLGSASFRAAREALRIAIAVDFVGCTARSLAAAESALLEHSASFWEVLRRDCLFLATDGNV